MSPILQGLANGSVRGYGGYLPLGPSGAFESIASATGTGSSGTITFSSIPSTYQSLQIRTRMLTAAGSGSALFMEINGNTTASNYITHLLYGDGATASATSNSGTAYIWLSGWTQGAETTQPYVNIIDIHNYANTSQNKTIRNFSGIDKNGSGEIMLSSGLFMQTAAITSIRLFYSSNNMSSSTQFALYGIKGA